jgi:hypothetical protein
MSASPRKALKLFSRQSMPVSGRHVASGLEGPRVLVRLNFSVLSKLQGLLEFAHSAVSLP